MHSYSWNDYRSWLSPCRFLSVQPPFQVQHLQSGDAKVTMARDGQDRGILLSPFDRKSRSAVAAFLGMKRWVFTDKPSDNHVPHQNYPSRNMFFLRASSPLASLSKALLNLLIGYLGGPLKDIHIFSGASLLIGRCFFFKWHEGFEKPSFFTSKFIDVKETYFP